MQTLIYGPAIIGALGLYFGLLLGDLFALPTSWNLGLGILTVLFLAVMNGFGTKYGGTIQVVTTVCKFVPIIMIIVFGLTMGILISIFGCLNGKILAFPRIAYAMASRKQLPFSRLLSKVSLRSGVPMVAMCFEVALALLVMVFSNPDYLSDMAVFAVYLFYILSFIAVFVLRKREPNFSTYRVPLYPVVPLIVILGSLFVVGTTLVNDFTDAIVAIGSTLIGLPVYAYIHRKSGPEGSGLSGGGGQA